MPLSPPPSPSPSPSPAAAAGPAQAELPALVLVPGLACDDTVWQPLLPWLRSVACPWVPPTATHHSISEMAEAVLRDAPAEHFALAGHSLGGRIALEVMRQAPARVRRLALLDTGWQPLAAGAAGEAERRSRGELVALARAAGMRAMGERWSPPMLHPTRLGSPVHEDVLHMIERQTAERFAAQQQALLARPDAGAVLDTTRCPTLLLCGREDGWSPPERHVEMAERIAHAQLVLVDTCGHMSTMEQPEAVARAMLAWLAEDAAP